MPTDVDVRFGAEFAEAKKALEAFRADMNSWGKGLAIAGAAGFAGVFALEMGKAVVAGVKASFDAAVGAVKEWVAAASEAQQVDVRLSTAVKNAGLNFDFTTEQLQGMATALQDVSTFGDEAIKSAQKILIEFRLTGQTFKDTTALAVDMASQMGTDVTSAAQTLGRAIADPARGMMLLTRQGIHLSQSQKDMIKSFVEGGEIVKAQAVLIDALEAKYAGAGKAMLATTEGGWAAFLEVVGDVKEELGGGLLPFIEALLPLIKEAAMQFREWAATLKDSLLAKSDEWIPALKDGVLSLTAIIITAVKDVVGTVEQAKNTLDQALNRAERLKLITMSPAAIVTEMGGAALHLDRLDELDDRFRQLQKQGEDMRNERGGGKSAAQRAKELKEEMASNLAATGLLDVLEGFQSIQRIGVPEAKAFAEGIGKFLGGESAGDALNLTTGKGLGQAIAGLVSEGVKELRSAPADFDEVIAGIRADQERGGQQGFTSGIEDAMGAFRRIQTATASTEDIPKKQLSVAEKQLIEIAEQKEKQEQANKSIRVLIDEVKKKQVAHAG